MLVKRLGKVRGIVWRLKSFERRKRDFIKTKGSVRFDLNGIVPFYF
jgi:hypothetical protein